MECMTVAVTKFNPYIELLSSNGGEKLRNIPAIRLEHIFFIKILLVLAHACDDLGIWLLYLQICHPRYGLQQVCVYAKEQPMDHFDSRECEAGWNQTSKNNWQRYDMITKSIELLKDLAIS